MNCLSVLEINPLLVDLFANIFFDSKGCLFIFWFSLLCRRSHLFIFVFIFITLGSGSKKILLWFMSKNILPVFPSKLYSIQPSLLFTQSCPTLCNPMDCSTRVFPVHHQLPELSQIHVHRVGDAIPPSHPLLPPSPPALSLSQHQVLFQSVSF